MLKPRGESSVEATRVRSAQEQTGFLMALLVAGDPLMKCIFETGLRFFRETPECPQKLQKVPSSSKTTSKRTKRHTLAPEKAE